MEENEERINKLRQKLHKITNALKEYVPEISGAAIGAAFGNPVAGAVVGTAAKKLLEAFLKAREKDFNADPRIQENVKRFSNATVAYSGTIKKKENQNKTYRLSKNANTSMSEQDIKNYYFAQSTMYR